MDLRDFQYLIALAEEGSVSRAADRLYMAQSSLSQFLQQYESELGVKLFIRTTKGIRPTANGEVFIGHLRQCLPPGGGQIPLCAELSRHHPGQHQPGPLSKAPDQVHRPS